MSYKFISRRATNDFNYLFLYERAGLSISRYGNGFGRPGAVLKYVSSVCFKTFFDMDSQRKRVTLRCFKKGDSANDIVYMRSVPFTGIVLRLLRLLRLI